MTQIRKNLRNLCIALFCPFLTTSVYSQTNPSEYLWYEAENMRGFSTGRLGEPLLNPSHTNWPREEAPGGGMKGPGSAAEGTRGGESEWTPPAASAEETRATLYQDFEIPR